MPARKEFSGNASDMSKIITVAFLSIFNFAGAQTCYHSNLSSDFDFKTTLERLPSTDSDTCIVTVDIISKKSRNLLQTIRIGSGWLFEPAFNDCSLVRSHSTHVNEHLLDQDNDFGDLIIADYNFDGKEDLSIKNDSGGNGGPTYSYFIQTASGSFILDNFLTESMEFFPHIINKSQRTLTTLVHANAYQLSKMIYKLHPGKNTWKRISHTFVDH